MQTTESNAPSSSELPMESDLLCSAARHLYRTARPFTFFVYDCALRLSNGGSREFTASALQLAELFGVNEKTVRNAFLALVRLGWFVVITPRCDCRVVTTLELFEHHFAKTSHSVLPPVTHTLSRPQNYSTATAAATAAPAASF